MGCLTIRSAMKRFFITLIFIIVAVFLIHPDRFASSSYQFIKKEHIPKVLEISKNAHKESRAKNLPLCNFPYVGVDPYLYPRGNISLEDLQDMPTRLDIEPGGKWHPKHCVSRYEIIIIIPFRNRHIHLNAFLAHMHPFLQQQLVKYRIVIVEQVQHSNFNRAKLMNIGFVEVQNISTSECYIFHDVDLLPQKLSNIYACSHNPRHMSSSLNQFRYHLPYLGLFGGAIAILKDQFEAVNGFSNVFYGWGGEDDDFKNRLTSHGFKITRFDPLVARYVMLRHQKETPSQSRLEKLEAGSQRFDSDGLSDLRYSVVEFKNEPLYTWFLVEL